VLSRSALHVFVTFPSKRFKLIASMITWTLGPLSALRLSAPHEL
jgi:hypothetical protein